jgi:hypothetical protein
MLEHSPLCHPAAHPLLVSQDAVRGSETQLQEFRSAQGLIVIVMMSVSMVRIGSRVRGQSRMKAASAALANVAKFRYLEHQ